jgi:hypothetical protein
MPFSFVTAVPHPTFYPLCDYKRRSLHASGNTPCVGALVAISGRYRSHIASRGPKDCRRIKSCLFTWQGQAGDVQAVIGNMIAERKLTTVEPIHWFVRRNAHVPSLMTMQVAFQSQMRSREGRP